MEILSAVVGTQLVLVEKELADAKKLHTDDTRARETFLRTFLGELRPPLLHLHNYFSIREPLYTMSDQSNVAMGNVIRQINIMAAVTQDGEVQDVEEDSSAVGDLWKRFSNGFTSGFQ